MIKKIKNYFYRFFYSIPFGLKSADAEIFGQTDSSNNSNIVIQQVLKKNNLGDALLEGEVTQEVEELRYQTYKVAKEANNFDYLGEGVAIKKKNTSKQTLIEFDNKIICEGVTHELNRVGEYSYDRYILKIKYSDIPRYKLERFCNHVKVDLNAHTIDLFFEKNTDIPIVRMLFNELTEILGGKKSELITYPKEISFFSKDGFTKYTLQDLQYELIVSEKFQFVLKYKFQTYKEEDFVEKFHSKSMSEKYEKKEKKNTLYSMNEQESLYFCSKCGKKINKYDYEITESTYGFALCEECLKEISKIKEDCEKYED